MIYRFILLLMFTNFFGATTHTNAVKYSVRTDVRFKSKSYSIFISEDGKGYVVKGNSSYFTQGLKYAHTSKSKVFTFDDTKTFFQNLRVIETHPLLLKKVNPQEVRIELYRNGKKIYDAPANTRFWVMYKPVINKLPAGYCPFCLSQRPF